VLVRMKINITGSRNGEPWPAPGGTLDVPDHEAADLIAAGYAVAADAQAAAPGAEDDASATAAVDYTQLTARHLKALAAKRRPPVDLGRARSKAEIVAALEAADAQAAAPGAEDTTVGEGDPSTDEDGDTADTDDQDAAVGA